MGDPEAIILEVTGVPGLNKRTWLMGDIKNFSIFEKPCDMPYKAGACARQSLISRVVSDSPILIRGWRYLGGRGI